MGIGHLTTSIFLGGEGIKNTRYDYPKYKLRV